MVTDHQEVQTRLRGPLEETSRCFRRLPEDRVVNVKADSDKSMTADVRRSSFAMTRFCISPAEPLPSSPITESLGTNAPSRLIEPQPSGRQPMPSVGMRVTPAASRATTKQLTPDERADPGARA